VLCTGATLLQSFRCMLSVWHGYANSYFKGAVLHAAATAAGSRPGRHGNGRSSS
jgi:hypothetical protein